MSLMWMFYIADMVDSLKGLIAFISWLSILIIVAITVTVFCDKEDFNTIKKGIKIILIPLVFMLITVFIPSKQTIYKMAAAYGVQEAVANPDVKRVAGKSLAVIEKTLDAYLKEDKQNGNTSE